MYFWGFSDIMERTSTIQKAGGNMLLYHGSKSGIKGKINPFEGRKACDFGHGFYMGDKPEQPKGLIANRKNGIYYEIEYDISDLKVKEFGDSFAQQLDWALFIAFNRKPELFKYYTALEKKYRAYNENYDVITGLIADDSMTPTLNRFFAGDSTDKEMIACLKHVKLGRQYVLKTEKACDNRIKILEQRVLTKQEIKLEKAQNEQRINEMDSILNMYKRKFRRDETAKYIDEIMKEWNDGTDEL